MTLTDWSIKTFHNKAWHVVRTYKQLWLLGLAVMIFTSGSSLNFNNTFDGSYPTENEDNQVEAQVRPTTDPELDPLYTLDDQLESQESMEAGFDEEALYEGYAEEANPFGDMFMDIFSRIQPLAWLLMTFSFIGYMIIGIMTYVVGSSWSQAALMLGVAEASADKEPNISKVSVRGLHYVKSVFLVGFLPWVIFGVIAFIGIILATIVGAIMQNGIFAFILGIVVLFALLSGFILVNVTIVLGSREAVIHSTGTKIAISRGWEMAKLYWRKAFSLFFRNGLIELLISIGLFLPGIIAVVGPVSSLFEQESVLDMNWQAFAPAVVLFIAATIAYFFFKSVYNVFTFTTWHLAHNVLRKATPSLNRA